MLSDHEYREKAGVKKKKKELGKSKIHLGESLHVVANDLGVWTLQFADDFKALIELREHIHHRAGEQCMF